MKTLTVGEFAVALRGVSSAVRKAEQHGLEEGAKLIKQEAKDLIGTEYAAWLALTDSTVARKAARGQTGRVSATDPLLATGELRATIGHQVDGNTAVIGTPDQVGVYQEFGTERIPPRPFLAPAAFRKGEAAAKGIGEAVQRALAGVTVG